MDPAYVLVLGLLALGYLARKLTRFPENASDTLNRFVIDLCVPAVLLRLIPTLHFEWDLLALVATPWLLALVAFGIARSTARWLHFDRQTEAVVFLCTAIGNTSFLGFPLVIALLGERALKYAAVYDQLGTFVLLSAISPIVLARAAGGSAPSAFQTLKRVLVFPPFFTLLIALVPFPRPLFLDPVLQQIGAALVPVAIFAVGLRLRITLPRGRAAFALALTTKLAVFPALAWGIGTLFHPPRTVFDALVLESAMPASVTAGALAMSAGLVPELAAAIVGWGIIAGLVTVPAWASLLR